jgi:hypothetical protein
MPLLLGNIQSCHNTKFGTLFLIIVDLDGDVILKFSWVPAWALFIDSMQGISLEKRMTRDYNDTPQDSCGEENKGRLILARVFMNVLIVFHHGRLWQHRQKFELCTESFPLLYILYQWLRA